MSEEKSEPQVVVLASEECQAGIAETFDGKRKPDFTVTKATPTFTKRGVVIIAWETVSAGFGEVTLALDENGQLVCDSEAMSREFVAKVFVKLLEGATWF